VSSGNPDFVSLFGSAKSENVKTLSVRRSLFFTLYSDSKTVTELDITAGRIIGQLDLAKSSYLSVCSGKLCCWFNRWMNGAAQLNGEELMFDLFRRSNGYNLDYYHSIEKQTVLSMLLICLVLQTFSCYKKWYERTTWQTALKVVTTVLVLCWLQLVCTCFMVYQKKH